MSDASNGSIVGVLKLVLFLHSNFFIYDDNLVTYTVHVVNLVCSENIHNKLYRFTVNLEKKSLQADLWLLFTAYSA
jgi:hypothetical protein